MEKYRIQWQDGPRLVGGDTWVVDLDLLAARGSTPFRFAKKLQVIATVDDLARLNYPNPDWTFWRALVAVAVGTVIRRLTDDELHLEKPRTPFQIAPDASEAVARATEMTTDPVVAEELITEFAAT